MSEIRADASHFQAENIQDAHVFLDFDHTLFGANSTELFITQCRPQPVVAVIDMLVRECIPWRVFGLRRHYRVRDYVCVMVLFLLTPWNVRSWMARAPALWKQYGQADFSSFLGPERRGEVTVVSFGMEPLIRPILSASEWRGAGLLATPRGASLKQLGYGKLDMVRAGGLSDAIASAAFVTDSEEDADLLRETARGQRIDPRGTVFRSMERLYIPLRYTMRAKYPFMYFIDQTLFVDIAIAVIATSWSLGSLLINAAVIIPLYLAFLCVYEIGYYENDFVGAARETSPTLTANVGRFQHYPIRQAWPWACGLTLCGAWISWALHAREATPPIAAALIWLGVLVTARGVFFVYNRSSIKLRLALYPLLQFIKYASILLMFPAASFTGEAVIIAQILMMATVYLVYRAAARRPELNKEAMRAAIAVIIVTIAYLGGRGEGVQGGLFASSVPLLWLALRNLKPIVMR